MNAVKDLMHLIKIPWFGYINLFYNAGILFLLSYIQWNVCRTTLL